MTALKTTTSASNLKPSDLTAIDPKGISLKETKRKVVSNNNPSGPKAIAGNPSDGKMINDAMIVAMLRRTNGVRATAVPWSNNATIVGVTKQVAAINAATTKTKAKTPVWASGWILIRRFKMNLE